MLNKRTWSIQEVETLEDLAYKLTQMTWCTCQGFGFGPYLFLNDAMCENGAQEYGVVRRNTREQIESVTFSWMSEEEALSFLRELLSPSYVPLEPFASVDANQLQSPETHGRCYACM